MQIPTEYIRKLESHGLFVSEAGEADSAFPGGVLVGKPESVKGNCIPRFVRSYAPDLKLIDDQIQICDEVRCDAPLVRLFGTGDSWFVLSQDYSPVFGPGDFKDEWATIDEAVGDILDFFFGSPLRMKLKADGRTRPAPSD